MKRRANKPTGASGRNGGDGRSTGGGDQIPYTIREWDNAEDAIPGAFPGPSHADAQLRVAFTREAYADLIHHAKSSLDAEICGVLVGHVMRDDEGEFVHVLAIIRGEAATFTQETWNQIHTTLEKDHPGMRIVGWYHTHPGFGVTFSDMDLFIQKHFFPLPTQIALVTDPLSGETAISINTDDGPGDLPRFWVDGREVRCHIGPGLSGTDEADSRIASKDYQALETRISQFIRNEDERRTRFYSALMFIGMIVLSFVAVGVGYVMYKYYTASPASDIPKIQDFGNIPITFQIDGKTIVLNVQVQGMVIAQEAQEHDTSQQVRRPSIQAPRDGDKATDGGVEK
jgi:proteasome lid subunit RPN8/RPN11